MVRFRFILEDSKDFNDFSSLFLVRRSNEPGWLEGTLNGKSGLIPENYVEILN